MPDIRSGVSTSGPATVNEEVDLLVSGADLVVTIGYDPVEYWPPEWNTNNKRKITRTAYCRLM